MWFKRGWDLFCRGDFDGALRCYEEALALGERSAFVWSAKGDAHYSLGDHKKALECHEMALALDDAYVLAWNGKGNAHYSLGDHKKALECYKKALALDDEFAHAWNGKGNALNSLGDYEEALECFEEALALDDEYAFAWNGKGNAHKELGNLKKAHRAYRICIHLDPTFPVVWFNLGQLYRNQFDDPARAQSAFIRSIHLFSTLGKFEAKPLQALQSMGAAPLLVARIYQEHGSLNLLLREPKGYAEALKRSERFFEWSALFAQDRSLPETFRLAVLGLEALALGDPIEAERLFTTLVETNPESFFAHYYLARSRVAYHEIGAAEEGLRVARSLIHDTMRRAMGSGRSPSAEQFYYAGLILSMDLSGSIAADGKPHSESRWKAARVFLETAVKHGWHPARFVLVDVLDACGDEEAYDAAIDDLLTAERALHENGRLGFLRGVPHSRLSFDQLVEAAANPTTETYDDAGYPSVDLHDPWELPGRAQATYTEITEALPFVYDWLHGPNEEPQDLPETYAFVDRNARVDPTTYQEGWHHHEQQSAAMEARRERVTAQELEELRKQLTAEVQEPFWEDWFNPDIDTASVSDATRLEKQLGHDIQTDIKGERADTHLKLIRYLVLQEAIPSRTATLLAAYYASCRADETQYDRSSKVVGGSVGYVLSQTVGTANASVSLILGSLSFLIGPSSFALSYVLTGMIAERLVRSLKGSCTYAEFKTHFYERLRTLRPDQQERLEKHGLWDSGYEEEMNRVAEGSPGQG